MEQPLELKGHLEAELRGRRLDGLRFRFRLRGCEVDFLPGVPPFLTLETKVTLLSGHALVEELKPFDQ